MRGESIIETLSPKRKKILSYIADYIQHNGYSPSVRDIAKGCAISSSSIVQYHLNVLQREGIICRGSDVSRSISLTDRQFSYTGNVPLLGAIAAGSPIPVPAADSWNVEPVDTIDFPPSLINGMNDIYALRVKGTSMIDALIDDGDIVLMQSVHTAEEGDMVAVWLKNEQQVTLKRFFREGDKIRLTPANSQMQPIYTAPENVEIQGKVVGVLRRF